VCKFSGHKEGGRRALEQALEVDPRFTPARINLGVEFFTQGDLAGAERCYRSALEIDPQETFTATWLCFLQVLTSRPDAAIAMAAEIGRQSDVFSKTGAFMLRVYAHTKLDDLAALRGDLKDGREAGTDAANLNVMEGVIAERSGRREQATSHLAAAEISRELNLGAVLLAATTAVRLGDPARALRLLNRPFIRDFDILPRIEPALHSLLDHPPYAPARLERTLVWPAEAPPVPESVAELFTGVRVEPGRITGTR